MVTLRGYDSSGRLESLFHREQLTGEVLAGFEYTYTPGGNRLRETEYRGGAPMLRTRYQHDARDQLVRADLEHGGRGVRGFRDLSYRWDPAGNRLERIRDGRSEAAEFNELNQMVRLDGLELSYDADGNMLLEPLGVREVRRFSYDCEGNLTETWTERVGRRDARATGPGASHQVKGPSPKGLEKRKSGKGKKKGHGKEPPRTDDPPEGSPRGLAGKRKDLRLFAYSPDGLKVEARIVPGHAPEPEEVQRRFWSGGQVLEELRYAPEDGPEDAEVLRYVRAAGGVAVEARAITQAGALAERRDEDRFYFGDVLGSTVLTTLEDLSGSEAFRYLPFGERVKGPKEDEVPSFTFTGLREEALGQGNRSQLYSAMHRHYRPGISRWVRRDPAGAVDGPNLFRYVGNRPTVLTDPTGLWFRAIATSFGNEDGPFEGSDWINAEELGAALPDRDTVKRDPSGRSVFIRVRRVGDDNEENWVKNVPLVDVGPWFTNDPYWTNGRDSIKVYDIDDGVGIRGSTHRETVRQRELFLRSLFPCNTLKSLNGGTSVGHKPKAEIYFEAGHLVDDPRSSQWGRVPPQGAGLDLTPKTIRELGIPIGIGNTFGLSPTLLEWEFEP